MSNCPICTPSCDARFNTRKKSIYIETQAKSSDCELDTNSNCCQEIVFDSDRGDYITIYVTASNPNGGISFHSNKFKKLRLKPYGSGRLEFAIRENSSSSSQQRGRIKLEIDLETSIFSKQTILTPIVRRRL